MTSQTIGKTYLLFGKSGAYTCNIDDIALDDTYISEMAPAKDVQLLALPFPLFLLLCEPLVTSEIAIYAVRRKARRGGRKTVTNSCVGIGLNSTASSE